HQDAADDERRRHRGEREGQVAQRLFEIHAAAPPVMSSPICSLFVVWGSTSPTILPPRSTPRVGCATSSSFGPSVSSRPITSFCWLPPESARAGSVRSGGRTSC